jgi:hypothetical protein
MPLAWRLPVRRHCRTWPHPCIWHRWRRCCPGSRFCIACCTCGNTCASVMISSHIVIHDVFHGIVVTTCARCGACHVGEVPEDAVIHDSLATASSVIRRLSLPKLAFATFAFATPCLALVMLMAPLVVVKPGGGSITWYHCRAGGLVAIPGVIPQQLGLQRSGQCRAGVFAGVALASLPALRWRHCQHCVVVAASIALALLPLLHRHLCPCHAGVVALVLPALPPALSWCLCPSRTDVCPIAMSLVTLCQVWLVMLVIIMHHCAGVFILVALVLSPMLHLQCRQPCAGLFALVTLTSAPSHRRL